MRQKGIADLQASLNSFFPSIVYAQSDPVSLLNIQRGAASAPARASWRFTLHWTGPSQRSAKSCGPTKRWTRWELRSGPTGERALRPCGCRLMEPEMRGCDSKYSTQAARLPYIAIEDEDLTSIASPYSANSVRCRSMGGKSYQFQIYLQPGSSVISCSPPCHSHYHTGTLLASSVHWWLNSISQTTSAARSFRITGWTSVCSSRSSCTAAQPCRGKVALQRLE